MSTEKKVMLKNGASGSDIGIISNLPCLTFPDGKCNLGLPTEELLSHLILEHSQVNIKNQMPIKFCEMFRSIKHFDWAKPYEVKYACKTIVSTIMYGGIREQSNSLPALNGICQKNINLPAGFAKYAAHLPIFFMIGRTSKDAFSRDQRELYESRNIKEDVYIFWLTSVPINKPMFFQLIAFSGNFMRCDARVSRIRDINETQDPGKILSEHKNYLLLTQSEMNALSYLRTKKISFRIGISDNEKELLDEGRVSFREVQFPNL